MAITITVAVPIDFHLQFIFSKTTCGHLMYSCICFCVAFIYLFFFSVYVWKRRCTALGRPNTSRSYKSFGVEVFFVSRKRSKKWRKRRRRRRRISSKRKIIGSGLTHRSRRRFDHPIHSDGEWATCHSTIINPQNRLLSVRKSSVFFFFHSIASDTYTYVYMYYIYFLFLVVSSFSFTCFHLSSMLHRFYFTFMFGDLFLFMHIASRIILKRCIWCGYVHFSWYICTGMYPSANQSLVVWFFVSFFFIWQTYTIG